MIPKVEFDADEAERTIQAVVDTFDFTLPGEGGQSLGRDLAVRGALGIVERSQRGLDVNGEPFKANSDDWAEYKLEKYQVDRPCELGGQMLSEPSMIGDTAITATEVIMVYGVDEAPTKTTSRSGVELEEWELKATDREKAGYCAEAGREFYAWDDKIAESIVLVAQARLDIHIHDLGF